ncbi:MAG: hypothetical protein AAGF31_02645 [Planctomycetota bacterium]
MSADAHSLLAQASNWQRMGDRFSGSHAQFDWGDGLSLFAVFAGAGLLIWLLHWASRHFDGKSSRPNPGRLLRDLCRTHGLSGRQRSLLVQLAEATDVEHACELFLRPELFDVANLPKAKASQFASEAKDLKQLAAILFAEPSPVATAREETGSNAENVSSPADANAVAGAAS